jgi:hypothetical protein
MISSSGLKQEGYQESYMFPAYNIMIKWFILLGSNSDAICDLFQGVLMAWSTPKPKPGETKVWVDAMIKSARHALSRIYPSEGVNNSTMLDSRDSGLPFFVSERTVESREALLSWLGCCRVLEDWRCLVTKGGGMGFGDGDIKKGDKIALVSGLGLVLILRDAGGAKWKLVGKAYVHGFMNGEAWPSKEEDLEEIVLV